MLTPVVWRFSRGVGPQPQRRRPKLSRVELRKPTYVEDGVVPDEQVAAAAHLPYKSEVQVRHRSIRHIITHTPLYHERGFAVVTPYRLWILCHDVAQTQAEEDPEVFAGRPRYMRLR